MKVSGNLESVSVEQVSFWDNKGEYMDKNIMRKLRQTANHSVPCD
jgi:hypothetical protein